MTKDAVAVWRHFCERLADIGDVYTGPDYPSGDPVAMAEGFHHLAKLVQQALKWYLDIDPDYPRLITLNDTFELADNRLAPIRAGATYLLRGDVSTLFDVNISLHEGWPFLGKRGVWGDLGLDDLRVEDDGTFELVIGPNSEAGNWLELPDAATFLHIREYYADWGRDRPGMFEIVRIGSEGSAPGRIDVLELAHRLEEVVEWARQYTPSHLLMINWLRSLPANTVQPSTRQQGGNANIAYAFGRFDLAPDECMVLEFPRPDARLWGVQWLTTPWYENPDIANRITSIVGPDAFVNDDGLVRIVVGAVDPTTPNWLDIGGYNEGVLAARWIWTPDDGPELTSHVIPAGQVRELLPNDTPVVDESARASMQADRRACFARRRR